MGRQEGGEGQQEEEEEWRWKLKPCSLIKTGVNFFSPSPKETFTIATGEQGAGGGEPSVLSEGSGARIHAEVLSSSAPLSGSAEPQRSDAHGNVAPPVKTSPRFQAERLLARWSRGLPAALISCVHTQHNLSVNARLCPRRAVILRPPSASLSLTAALQLTTTMLVVTSSRLHDPRNVSIQPRVLCLY